MALGLIGGGAVRAQECDVPMVIGYHTSEVIKSTEEVKSYDPKVRTWMVHATNDNYILYATSKKALTAALQLARDSGGRLRLLHSVDELAYLSGFEYSGDVIRVARDNAAKVLDDASAMVKAAGVEVDQILVDQPGQRLGETVSEAARSWDADLIVVGTHGRRGFSRMFMGSGAEQVIRVATVPVLVIRGEESDAKP